MTLQPLLASSTIAAAAEILRVERMTDLHHSTSSGSVSDLSKHSARTRSVVAEAEFASAALTFTACLDAPREPAGLRRRHRRQDGSAHGHVLSRLVHRFESGWERHKI